MMQRKFITVSAPDTSGGGESRRIAYSSFGEPDNPRVLVCVHGVSRLSRDFDRLAEAVSGRYRVICPDMTGRGDSDPLPRAEDYGYGVYLADIKALLRDAGAEKVHWVGTSMGGLIGMMLAAEENSPIERMVINDIGPVIPKDALARIGTYLGTAGNFKDLAASEAYLRDVHCTFGPLADDEWTELARHSFKPAPDGKGLVLHYDPKIAEPFKAGSDSDIVLWKIWDRIKCPVLVLRGAESDLLASDTAAEMAQRGPEADITTLAGIGHAPALMNPAQIAIVRDWLANG
ncbi:MAG: alpha/beta hydrolase [Rhodospirillaceae bacterium]